MAASTSLIPNVSSHTPPYQIPTYAYIWAEPDPIGVGQTATVFMWLNQIFGVGFDTTSYALLSNNYRFHNYNFTVVAPDGTVKTTIFDVVKDSTSNQITSFTPDQVGTYTLIFDFPGQAYAQYPGQYNPNSILVNDTYLPSSATETLTVQSEPIPPAVGSSPLPTAYWTRPIYGENSDWWTISSNWLGAGSAVNPAVGSGPVSAFSTGPPINMWGAIISRNPGDAIGSMTSHVMWTKPIQSGGVVGGNSFYEGGGYPGTGQGVGYYEGTAYEQRFINPIIMDGILYYMAPVGFDAPSYGPLVALNLQTGQVVWTSNTLPPPSFGYIYNLWNPDEHGTFPPILICPLGNTWLMVDAFTGTVMFNVTGVPSGYVAAGPSGEQLRYVLTNKGTSANPNWYLAEWNSSRLWQYDINPFTGAGSLSPAIINASNSALVTIFPASNQAATPFSTLTVDGDVGINTIDGALNTIQYPSLATYDWNISIPSLNNPGGPTPSVIAAMYNNVMLILNGSLPASPGSFTGQGSYTPYSYMAFNLNPSNGNIGAFKWINTLQPPPGNVTVYYAGVDPTTNVFVEENYETLNWVGYSLTTGQKIWGPTPPQQSLDYYGQTAPNEMGGQLAFGNLYTSAYGGVVYCYNDSTGELEWTYGNGGSGNSTIAGFDSPYGVYPTFIQAVGSNGVIYLVTTEHTVIDPIYKGAKARAINATTGAEIWTISDYTSEFIQMSYVIADGCTTFFNGYDGQIYTLGRGPSQTTVTAPNTGLAFGQSVVIRGSVTDISAGTKQTQQKADFPNGVPVSSDANMGAWMGYVYQQQPMPTNFTGVPVTITVTDSNGNSYDIGTATTNPSGMYTLTWTPTIPGDFTVTATFAGTTGYWPSTAETSFNVMEAATPAPTSAIPTGIASTDTVVYGIVAIIIVIVIIGILQIVLMQRKRP
ncbi:MAG: PQQ-binding-like beta-propeller repeat protein [Chloroflexi bacterium]|nr:PQQ-binding-like beta-propeller repeat protein [Chloroflexota bacterium]